MIKKPISQGLPITKLAVIGSVVVGLLLALISLAAAARYSQSASVNVFIGNPSACAAASGTPVTDPEIPCGWPTTGYITQLPFEADPSHGSLSAIDIGSADGLAGWPVYATHDGRALVFTGNQPFPNQPADRIVTVTSSKYLTKYQHLLKQCVANGAQVTRGTLIGLMDNTGYSQGNHLHYEIDQVLGAALTLAEFNSLVPPYSKNMSVTTGYGNPGDTC